MADLSGIASVVAVGLTLFGCALSAGIVLGKVSRIDEISKAIARLVESNHLQDMTLAKITQHLGIDDHRPKMYESR